MRTSIITIKTIFLTIYLVMSLPASSQNENWTFFRGSYLNGIAEKDSIPLKWDTSAVKWKTMIHDKGYSSPVIYGDQIWITTAAPDGKELYAMCIDYNSGKVIHDIKVFSPDQVGGKHTLNTYASPTPCIEDGFVYVHYGSLGTACLNTTSGAVVWKRTDLKCNHVQGPASSPVLYKNLLILHYEGTDARFIIALDKSNGKTVWKVDRPVEPYKPLPEIGRKAYITPIIINFKGQDMLISNGSAVCIAYDPDTGREIWRVVDGAESTIAMPVTENGLLYWYTGFTEDNNGKSTEIIAVNPDGNGDITSTNILWRKKEKLSRNQCLTPVIKDGLIYTVNTLNTMMCIDAANGNEVWTTHVTSNYDASPLYINGNIWFFSVRGDIVALKAGRKYEVIARNKMDSGIWATPAVVRNSVILRTEKYLCRISID